MYVRVLILTLCLFFPRVLGSVWCQQREDLSAGLEVSAEVQGSLSDGVTPLWLNANKYGLSSLDDVNGYLRVMALRPSSADSARRWKWGYGLDVAIAGGYTSTLILQQAFAELSWGYGTLSFGSKEETMPLRNATLSSGSQTLGINARPVPQIRLSLHDYWPVPGTKHWLHVLGHIAYGRFTDGSWQKHFTADKRAEVLDQGYNGEKMYGRYCTNVLYHSKALYIKVGESYTLPQWSIELGVEMASQFGGQIHYVNTDGELEVVKVNSGLSAYLHALTAGGSDDSDGMYPNEEGNHLGSILARINYNNDLWGASVYFDHFFEDYSGMVFLAYDGYGEGDDWNRHTTSTYYRFPLKDMLLGLEVRLKRFPWVKNIVMEYVYTKYQSGPYNHDTTQTISDSIDGKDDYYNHGMYNAWQHWGQVMGNPLYLSPIYNDDGVITVRNNRFVAFHGGVNGTVIPRLDYRVLLTYQSGWGTYYYPYTHKETSWSGLIEANYTVTPRWQVTCGIGFDHGELRGNNVGVQLTARATLWRGEQYK